MDYICKQPDFGIYVSKKIKNKQRKKTLGGEKIERVERFIYRV